MAEKLATLSDLIEKQNAKIDKLTKEVTHLRNHNPRYQEDLMLIMEKLTSLIMKMT